MDTYEAVRACAELLLGGTVLQRAGVSAGNGRVIDWRTVPSGETLQEDADAFDTAQLFVALVGPEAALSVIQADSTPPPPFVAPPPRITAFAESPRGGRRRRFDVGSFTVLVEPHEDDERQAEFTRRLAEAATSCNL